MTEMIRVLVADDHPVVREGICAMLEAEPDLEVVGDVGDGRPQWTWRWRRVPMWCLWTFRWVVLTGSKR